MVRKTPTLSSAQYILREESSSREIRCSHVAIFLAGSDRIFYEGPHVGNIKPYSRISCTFLESDFRKMGAVRSARHATGELVREDVPLHVEVKDSPAWRNSNRCLASDLLQFSLRAARRHSPLLMAPDA